MSEKTPIQKADDLVAMAGTLSGVGELVKTLQFQRRANLDEIRELTAQNDILRSDLRKAQQSLNAAIHAKEAPIALSTDEHWLFQRDATFKFRSSSDGRRILVMRCRGEKILRLRDQITTKGQTSNLFQQALETGRRRADGRNRKGKTMTRKQRAERKRYLAARNAEVLSAHNKREAEKNGGEGTGQKDSPNEALARRQDRFAGIDS